MSNEPRIKFIKLKDSMIINYGTQSVTVHSGEARYSVIEEALKENDFDKVFEILEGTKRRKIRDLLKITDKKKSAPNRD